MYQVVHITQNVTLCFRQGRGGLRKIHPSCHAQSVTWTAHKDIWQLSWGKYHCKIFKWMLKVIVGRNVTAQNLPIMLRKRRRHRPASSLGVSCCSVLELNSPCLLPQSIKS